MAHTKQMPRNPNVNRPTTVICSDVQPEQKTSTKQMSRKLPMKGGKLPRKPLSQKQLRQDTSALGGYKKPHLYQPGILALRQIRRYQESIECLIKRTPFQKLIGEISQEHQDMSGWPWNSFCPSTFPINSYSCSSRDCREFYWWTF